MTNQLYTLFFHFLITLKVFVHSKLLPLITGNIAYKMINSFATFGIGPPTSDDILNLGELQHFTLQYLNAENATSSVLRHTISVAS